MTLNLDNKPFPGFGNVCLMVSQYYRQCMLTNKKPVIYTKTPERVVGIKNELFEFTTDDTGAEIMPVTLNRLFNVQTAGYLHKVVDVPDVSMPSNIKAGFSFRFGDPAFDDEYEFMNQTCVNAMLHQFSQYERVFVCSNKNDFIVKLKHTFGDKIYSVNDEGEDCRFSRDHLKQWVMLSKCPIVYHPIQTVGSPDHMITSTFAPTAAVYGGCEVVGVNNNGQLFHGNTYHW